MRYKYGLSTAFAAPHTAPILLVGNIRENLRIAAGIGYQALEVHMREDTPLDYSSILSECEQTGVRVAQIITGRLCTEGKLTLVAADESIESAALAGMRRYIDMAARLRADIVLGWAKGNPLPRMALGQYYDRLAEKVILLDRYARENGVKINIEAINHYECATFTKAAETLSFIEKYDLRQTYVHLDTFHMNIEEDDIPAAIRLCKNKLGYFHVADAQRWYPGSAARIDFKSIYSALADINYTGMISLECFPREDGVKTAQKALNYLKQLEF